MRRGSGGMSPITMALLGLLRRPWVIRFEPILEQPAQRARGFNGR
jgi:hypothetical protein